MALKKYKPTSPGRRFMSVSSFEEITKTEPEKSLTAPIKKTGGRNVNGRITTRHQGGGHKRRYGSSTSSAARTGSRRSRLDRVRPEPVRADRAAPLRRRRKGVHPGARAARGRARRSSRPERRIRPATRSPREHPDRHARPQRRAEARPGRKDGPLRRLRRTMVAKDDGYGVLRLPSGEMRRVPLTCRATVGQVATSITRNQTAKGGRSRWKGKRPSVRARR